LSDFALIGIKAQGQLRGRLLGDKALALAAIDQALEFFDLKLKVKYPCRLVIELTITFSNKPITFSNKPITLNNALITLGNKPITFGNTHFTLLDKLDELVFCQVVQCHLHDAISHLFYWQPQLLSA
jgi:hypothetical protein